MTSLREPRAPAKPTAMGALPNREIEKGMTKQRDERTREREREGSMKSQTEDRVNE